jgi:hypothetical protein
MDVLGAGLDAAILAGVGIVEGRSAMADVRVHQRISMRMPNRPDLLPVSRDQRPSNIYHRTSNIGPCA